MGRRRSGRARAGAAVRVLAAATLLAGCSGGSTARTQPRPSPTPLPTVATASPSATPARSATPPAATVQPSASVTPRVGSSTAAPSSPYVTQVRLPAGCVTVGPAIVGVKVYLVQAALGLVGHLDRYDAATAAAVRTFQAAHRLPVTGLVDERTWTALGTGQPFCIDRYTAQPTVTATATAAARVAALLRYATSRVGVTYIWGGAGPIGYDCSGLALQAMYSGGRVVPGVTTDLHIQATFNTAAAIYHSPALPHVPFAQRQRGDLVFWGTDFSHMALYLGQDQIVEAVRPTIRTASLWVHGTPLPTVVRPFPG